MSPSYRRRLRQLGIGATCLALTAACGSRISEAEIKAGAASGGQVTLSPSANRS